MNLYFEYWFDFGDGIFMVTYNRLITFCKLVQTKLQVSSKVREINKEIFQLKIVVFVHSKQYSVWIKNSTILNCSFLTIQLSLNTTHIYIYLSLYNRQDITIEFSKAKTILYCFKLKYNKLFFAPFSHKTIKNTQRKQKMHIAKDIIIWRILYTICAAKSHDRWYSHDTEKTFQNNNRTELLRKFNVVKEFPAQLDKTTRWQWLYMANNTFIQKLGCGILWRKGQN